MLIILTETKMTSFNINTNVWIPIIVSMLSATVFTLFINIIPNKYKKSKYISIANNYIRRALIENAELLAKMYKACVEEESANKASEYSVFFNDDFVEVVTQLKLRKQSPTIQTFSWVEYLYEKLTRLSQQLNDVTLKFSDYLDIEVVENLEKLKLSGFVQIFTENNSAWLKTENGWEESTMLWATLNNPHDYTLEGSSEIIKQHMDSLLVLINSYNESLTKKRREKSKASKTIRIDDNFWSTGSSPFYNSGR